MRGEAPLWILRRRRPGRSNPSSHKLGLLTVRSKAPLCGALSVTVPTEELPPTTLDGLTDTPESTGGGGLARTVRTPLKLYRPSEAVTVTLVSAEVGRVAIDA